MSTEGPPPERDTGRGDAPNLRQFDLLERYHLCRAQVEHEDGLVGQRTTWYLTLQGFLFTAVFVAIGLFDGTHVERALQPHLLVVVFLLLFVGAASSIVCYLLIDAAYRQIEEVRTWWQQQPGAGHLPPVSGTGGMRGLSGAEFVLVIYAVWLVFGACLVFAVLKSVE